jgi:hypothetical protein
MSSRCSIEAGMATEVIDTVDGTGIAMAPGPQRWVGWLLARSSEARSPTAGHRRMRMHTARSDIGRMTPLQERISATTECGIRVPDDDRPPVG